MVVHEREVSVVPPGERRLLSSVTTRSSKRGTQRDGIVSWSHTLFLIIIFAFCCAMKDLPY